VFELGAQSFARLSFEVELEAEREKNAQLQAKLAEIAPPEPVSEEPQTAKSQSRS